MKEFYGLSPIRKAALEEQLDAMYDLKNKIEEYVSTIKAVLNETTYLTPYHVKRLVFKKIKERPFLEAANLLMDTICNIYGISKEAFLGKSRVMPVIYSRCHFVWFFRELADTQYVKLGSFMNRDHSTLINTYKKACDELETNNVFANTHTNIMYEYLGVLCPLINIKNDEQGRT